VDDWTGSSSIGSSLSGTSCPILGTRLPSWLAWSIFPFSKRTAGNLFDGSSRPARNAAEQGAIVHTVEEGLHHPAACRKSFAATKRAVRVLFPHQHESNRAAVQCLRLGKARREITAVAQACRETAASSTYIRRTAMSNIPTAMALGTRGNGCQSERCAKCRSRTCFSKKPYLQMHVGSVALNCESTPLFGVRSR
jgi:hypothetical protein